MRNGRDRGFDLGGVRQFKVRAGRWNLNVAACGDQGRAVLLLPGLGGSWVWWLPHMRELAERHRVFAVDLPGAGDSSAFGRFPTPSEIFDATAGVVERLELNDCLGVGHSLGGYALLQYLLQGGEGIARCMVLAPGGVVPMPVSRWRIGLLHLIAPFSPATPLYRKLITLQYSHLMAEVGDDIDRLVRWDTRRAVNRWSLAYQLFNSRRLALLSDLPRDPAVEGLEKRVQIVWGARDKVFPADCARRLSKMLGGAPRAIYPGADHWPHYDQAERFRADLLEFAAR